MKNNNQQKYIVVDTSALIEIPDVIQRVDPATVFVPLTVIKQLDGLKNNPDIERSKKARSASFFIDEGMKNGNVTVLTAYDHVDGLDNASDNKIVGAAVRLKRENPEAVVALLATDRNMRIVAEAHGIVGKTLNTITGKLNVAAQGPKGGIMESERKEAWNLFGTKSREAFNLYLKKKKTRRKIHIPFFCYVLIVVGALLCFVVPSFILNISTLSSKIGSFGFGIVLLMGGIIGGFWLSTTKTIETGMTWDEYISMIDKLRDEYVETVKRKPGGMGITPTCTAASMGIAEGIKNPMGSSVVFANENTLDLTGVKNFTPVENITLADVTGCGGMGNIYDGGAAYKFHGGEDSMLAGDHLNDPTSYYGNPEF